LQILPGVQSVDPAVRNAAVLALGLTCLQSQNTAKQYLLLFMQIAHMDHEAVKATALRVIFDVLLVFGFAGFELEVTDDEKEETEMPRSSSSLISILTALLNSEVSHWLSFCLAATFIILFLQSAEIRTVCAEGFAKLMLGRHLSSPKLLSRLVLLWYNPITEDDTHLRNCLGTFLPLYAFASRSGKLISFL
jgi:condensin complex subunit 3